MIGNANIENLHVVGDRVLVKPLKEADKTSSGLYLPPGVQMKEKIYRGFVIKVGPGVPIPIPQEVDEPWKTDQRTQYLPLQAQQGDMAIYIQHSAHEVVFNEEKYVIIPQSAILLLYRDQDL